MLAHKLKTQFNKTTDILTLIEIMQGIDKYILISALSQSSAPLIIKQDLKSIPNHSNLLSDLGLKNIVYLFAIDIAESNLNDFITCNITRSIDFHINYIHSTIVPYLNYTINDSHNTRLLALMYNIIYNARRLDIFDMILNFSSCSEKFIDLKTCLSMVVDQDMDGNSRLSTTLKHLIQSRLLHQGNSTQDILLILINIIDALEFLELDLIIIEPIKIYLNNRSNSVRTIVLYILNSNRQNIVKELISIHEIDAFFIDFQDYLATSFIQNDGYNVELEAKQIEIFLNHIGTSNQNSCKVMIKDVKESFSLYSNFGSLDFKPTIISHLFWPSQAQINFKCPLKIQDSMSKFKNHYQSQQEYCSRLIKWIPNLGNVNLELIIDNKTHEFTCSTLSATIITLFESKNTLTLQEIHNLLECDSPQVLNAINYWVTNGIISLEETIYKLEKSKTDVLLFNDDEQISDSKHDWNTFRMIVVHYLTNQGESDLDKVFEILKLFGQYSGNVGEVRVFLDKLVLEGVVVLGRRGYLVKESS